MSAMLTKIEANIKKYQADHRGEKPLYILVSPYEADSLYDEVRQAGGYSIDTIVTTYQGSKIVKYEALKRGDLQLTDELPEASG